MEKLLIARTIWISLTSFYICWKIYISRSASEYNKFDSICKQIYCENISKAVDYITYRYEKKSLVNCKDHSSFDFISAVLIWYISYTFITVSWQFSHFQYKSVDWQLADSQWFVSQLLVTWRLSWQYVSPFFITWRSWFKLFQHLQTSFTCHENI